jgi:hypothetical protein
MKITEKPISDADAIVRLAIDHGRRLTWPACCRIQTRRPLGEQS